MGKEIGMQSMHPFSLQGFMTNRACCSTASEENFTIPEQATRLLVLNRLPAALAYLFDAGVNPLYNVEVHRCQA